MITLIPVFVLLFFALLIQIIGRLTQSPGRTWFVSSIVALGTWISMILIRVFLPAGLEIENWLSSSSGAGLIQLQFTEKTWILGFLLASLFVAVVFIEARNLEQGNHINTLSVSMILTAFGLLALQARNSLTFLLVWVVIDLVEFGILVWIINEKTIHKNAISSLILRMCGLILTILIVTLQKNDVLAIDGENNLAVSGGLILLTALLRSGIIPIHVPYIRDTHLRRGMGTLLRFIPPLTVLAFLINTGNLEFTNTLYQVLPFILTVGAFYGAISWFFSKDELSGRSYWIFSIFSLALISLVRQSPDALTGLAVLMIIGGSAIFLYSPRLKLIKGYIFIIVLGLLTIPFSPTTGIKQFLWSENFNFFDLILIFILALLVAGIFRHSSKQDIHDNRLEDWMRFFYVSAYTVLLLSPWVNVIFVKKGSVGIQYWWISLILMIFIGIMVFSGYLGKKIDIKYAVFYRSTRRILGPGVLLIDKVLRFGWLNRLTQIMGSTISSGIAIFVRVLEGDGGILWSFLFLVLLASLLATRLVP